MRFLSSTLLLGPVLGLAAAPQDAAPARTPPQVAEIVRDLATCAANTDKAQRLEAYDALAKRLGVLPPVPGAWKVQAAVNPIDDSRTVMLGLASEKEIAGDAGKSFQPELVLRCKAGKLELYTITGVVTEEEKPDQRTAATVRFGKEKAATIRMDRSTEGDALFWPDAEANIAKLLEVDRLAVQFSPKGFEPVILEFDLRGLAQAHPQLAEACAGR